MALQEEYLAPQLCSLRDAQQRYLDHELREIGLYCGQELVVLYLAEHEGPTQVQLAQQMNSEPQTINKMLQRMQKAGLVERRGDPDDGRVTRVYLTPRGYALVLPIQEIRARCEERLTAGLTGEERLLIHRLLTHMRGNFDPSLRDFAASDRE